MSRAADKPVFFSNSHKLQLLNVQHNSDVLHCTNMNTVLC